MQMAARMVQDDLAIMFEKPDGEYYFLAGSILLAGFWRLEDKFGMPLSEIHTSGNVPGYQDIFPSCDRYCERAWRAGAIGKRGEELGR